MVQSQPVPAGQQPATAVPDTVQLDGEAGRRRLIEAMETAGWVQAKAARILGITARQVGYALRKHGIDVKRF